MSRCTQTEALRLFSALADADAGRLTGASLLGPVLPAIRPGQLTAESAGLLAKSLYRPRDTPAGAEMICYVVSSDGTPVAWLTYDAHVHAPPSGALTGYQRAHQQRAVTALSGLTRRAVAALARLRDHRDGRIPGDPPDPLDTSTRLLVAHATDPTLTWWVKPSGDLGALRNHLTVLTGQDVAEDGQVRVLEVDGFGDYGRHREHLELSVLCAIDALSATHEVPTSVIGDWLDAEGATRTDVTAAQITRAFTEAFAGIHPGRRSFAEAERDRLGWTAAMAAAGIPLRYFDTPLYTASVFDHTARAIRMPSPLAGIAVFRRGKQPA
ncbi:hypothetical protein [Catenuloplanes indicus]|uniref:Uncharacterized protein n=1 Tax=Catenuloplanes indicus TaxID=137267 RepID=A0AAE4AY52_9ACTN|nr:hypothetical protein [Catenuloplanes indicus]MDQ0366859.1 hypothetical protein [Catenuloplanes indicus]